ncbi:MAG TPA: peptidylprolyl isomerase [Usitatibacteraceae bacterium]|nr:peptidylprolyl isomerase [Usitatibacteraceae bacterium]
MNSLFATLAAAAAITAAPLAAAETPLVKNGDIVVTEADFEAYMERVPLELRNEAKADGERNNKVVDLIFSNRVLAQEARKAGLDKDPALARRIQQHQEAFLALQYVAYLERIAPIPADLEARALELYLTKPDRYTEPDRVELQHVLVGLIGRTREQALARAEEVRAKAVGGADFLALAREYSDDPGLIRNGGRLGAVTDKEIDHRIAKVAFGMKSDGEISAPIVATHGVHIVKRTGFKPSFKRKFEDVKEAIIEETRARLRSEVSLKLLDAWRRSPETQWNAKAIAALRTEVPRDELKRKQREAVERMAEEAKEAATPAAPPARN